MLALGAFSGLMIASQASPIGQDMFGLSAATAAAFVSVYSACNAFGRLAWGAVSDRLGYTNALMLIYGLIALSLLVLVSGRAVGGFAVGIIGLGLCFGGVMGVFPALVMKNFGPRFQGVNYGITFTAYSISAFFAPRIAASWGESHDGDFTGSFVIAIVLALTGLALTVAFTAVQRRKVAPGLGAATPETSAATT
jgi:OFA family oxalate/formate antiporter-like MFS transporter